ncbi:unnamed protein product, partial [Ectocarpus sp. 6 AP-2014]
MGAACSTTGVVKYKTLKGYIQSKDCLAFKSVRGFLPGEEYGHGPPIVLIGEDHSWSESEENRRTCATALLAMYKIVSTCSDGPADLKLPTVHEGEHEALVDGYEPS